MTDSKPSAGDFLAPGLYVVATPLGNLADLTERARYVLGHASAIACEDTRHTQKLLEHLSIRAPLFAVHEHNELQAADQIVQRIARGEAVALVSDAGTPGISDPGARAVRAVQEAGAKVIPVPGPSAVVTALSASGVLCAHFLFLGFLPTKTVARRAAIEAVRETPYALVCYEAPHRIAETLADLAAVLPPDREIVIARELTKLFEQIARMPVADAPAWLAADPNRSRGEFVLIVSPPASLSDISPKARHALTLLLAELPLKSAVRLASELTGESKNALYDLALSLKAEQDGAV